MNINLNGNITIDVELGQIESFITELHNMTNGEITIVHDGSEYQAEDFIEKEILGNLSNFDEIEIMS